MDGTEGLLLEKMRALVELSGFDLTDAELASLKPMWDYYVDLIKMLHEVTLDGEDPAVVFSATRISRG